MPKYARLNERTGGEGTEAWQILFRAWQDKLAGKKPIIMAVGDPDFNTPQPIIEAAKRALDEGHTHYAQIPGIPELREAVAREMMRVSGFSESEYSLKPENIMVMQGTQNAIFSASMVLLEEDDEVIVLDPCYITYDAVWSINGASIVRVAMPRESGFRPQAEAIAAAVTDRTKAIVMTNPNNPTGVVMTREEVEAIAAIARKHDLWVISDEVYATQTFGAPHVSIAGLPGMKERTITCGSLSKAQAMTGWRIGWLSGPEEFITNCEKLAIAMHYGVAPFIQKAAIEALGNSLSEIGRMLELYRNRCNVVLEHLSNTPGLTVIEPEGAMYVLVDVTGTGLTSGEFSRKLYDAEEVAVLDAKPFGEPANGCIRIAFTISEQELAEGCERIRRFAMSLAA